MYGAPVIPLAIQIVAGAPATPRRSPISSVFTAALLGNIIAEMVVYTSSVPCFSCRNWGTLVNSKNYRFPPCIAAFRVSLAWGRAGGLRSGPIRRVAVRSLH